MVKKQDSFRFTAYGHGLILPFIMPAASVALRLRVDAGKPIMVEHGTVLIRFAFVVWLVLWIPMLLVVRPSVILAVAVTALAGVTIASFAQHLSDPALIMYSLMLLGLPLILKILGDMREESERGSPDDDTEPLVD